MVNEMRERPILFDTDMVKAILVGRKTQTRRVIKPQPSGDSRAVPWMYDINGPDASYALAWQTDDDLWSGYSICPYGKPGDRLWVRETWTATRYSDAGGYKRENIREETIRYKSSVLYADDRVIWRKWYPSIHMPRWASRIDLEIVHIRVERLQGISELDAEAEGVEVSHYYCDEGMADDPMPIHRCDPVGKFQESWDSIYLKRPGYSWADNPFVWVIEFRRVD